MIKIQETRIQVTGHLLFCQLCLVQKIVTKVEQVTLVTTLTPGKAIVHYVKSTIVAWSGYKLKIHSEVATNFNCGMVQEGNGAIGEVSHVQVWSEASNWHNVGF